MVADGSVPGPVGDDADEVGRREDADWAAAVVDHMTEAVVTTSPDTAARAVAGLMCEHDISHVPVVENGEAVGLVSATDLTEHVAGAVADATE